MLGKVVLPILTLLTFLLIVLFSKNIRRDYLLFVLYGLPFMDFTVTNAAFGSFRTFDVITLITTALSINKLSFARFKKEPYPLLLILLLAICFLGSIASMFITNALVSLCAMLPIFMFGKLLLDELSEDCEFVHQVTLSIKTVALVSLLFLSMQMIFGLTFTWYANLNPNTVVKEGLRFPSFFHDPQKFAQYLAMVSFVFLSPNGDITAKNILSFLIIVGALLVTGGRSALIGLSFATIVVLLIGKIRTKLAIGTCLIIGATAFFLFSENFVTLSRIGQFGGDYEFRHGIWQEAWEIFTNHPGLGIGIGNYQHYAAHHSLNQFFIYDNEVEYFDQPENGYLKLLTELGGPGFVVFALLLILPLANNAKQFINGTLEPRYYGIIAGLVSWLVAFNSVYSLADKRIMLLTMTYVCLLIAAGRPVNTTAHADQQN